LNIVYRLETAGFLTESSKSPASIAQSNKQWAGTCLYQEWCKPLLISCKAAFGYEQVAKRIANIRLTTVIDKNVSKLSNQRGEVKDRDFCRNSIKI